MNYYRSENISDFKNDEFFMKEAIQEAQKSLLINEVPIGAVVAYQGRVIGRGHNLTEQLNDVTAHAEMQAFTAASNHIGAKYLKDCSLYVTIEPCVMCAGAAYWTQIARVVYGADDPKRGYSRIEKNLLHPRTEMLSGVLATECAQLISEFFLNLRSKS